MSLHHTNRCRSPDNSQAVADALQAAASTPQVNAGTLGVLEMCVSLIADPFLVATVTTVHLYLQGCFIRHHGTC